MIQFLTATIGDYYSPTIVQLPIAASNINYKVVSGNTGGFCIHINNKKETNFKAMIWTQNVSLSANPSDIDFIIICNPL